MVPTNVVLVLPYLHTYAHTYIYVDEDSSNGNKSSPGKSDHIREDETCEEGQEPVEDLVKKFSSLSLDGGRLCEEDYPSALVGPFQVLLLEIYFAFRFAFLSRHTSEVCQWSSFSKF